MQLILGHQGGWDEFLYFVVPILIALGAIRWASRRAAQGAGENDDSSADTEDA